jgi:hypothetical protein
MSDIKFEIIKKIGMLSETASRSNLPGPSAGWSKQLNLISWNGREPKYDLRDWSADGEKMSKGITLSREELNALKDLLNHMHL